MLSAKVDLCILLLIYKFYCKPEHRTLNFSIGAYKINLNTIIIVKFKKDNIFRLYFFEKNLPCQTQLCSLWEMCHFVPTGCQLGAKQQTSNARKLGKNFFPVRRFASPEVTLRSVTHETGTVWYFACFLFSMTDVRCCMSKH